MELYRKYPVLITVWALMENLLFAGVIFGWGSLVFILKDEGFYFDYCKQSGIFKQPQNATSVPSAPSHLPDNVTVSSRSNKVNEMSSEGCPAQESKLNLWYSIAASAMYLTYAAIAYFQRRAGTRIIRAIFLFAYLIGTLCMAFTTPDLPWLLLPGLTGMGIGGMTLACTNTQVAYLHPRLQSTIVALFSGLFDLSSVNKQLIRIAYENGISRRTSYIFMSVVFVVITSISTMLFLPKMFIGDDYLEEVENKRKQFKARSEQTGSNNTLVEHVLNKDDPGKSSEQELVVNNNSVYHEAVPDQDKSKPTLCSIVLSATCVLHLYWAFIHSVRFVTFIGQLNAWLENVYHRNETKVGEMLAIFSYMTMAAVAPALFCGFVYDYQRKQYIDGGKIKSVYLPAVVPICLVIFYSVGTTVFCMIKNEVTPYFAFAFFIFFRSSLFGIAIAFVGNAFPVDYFGNLIGIVLVVTGIGGLAQYPLFQWYEAYEGSYIHTTKMVSKLAWMFGIWLFVITPVTSGVNTDFNCCPSQRGAFITTRTY